VHAAAQSRSEEQYRAALQHKGNSLLPRTAHDGADSRLSFNPEIFTPEAWEGMKRCELGGRQQAGRSAC